MESKEVFAMDTTEGYRWGDKLEGKQHSFNMGEKSIWTSP